LIGLDPGWGVFIVAEVSNFSFFIVFLLGLYILLPSCASQEVEDERIQYQEQQFLFEHALTSNQFTVRGIITHKHNRTNHQILYQDFPLSPFDTQLFLRLIASEEYYQVRLSSKTQENPQYLLASVRLRISDCGLIKDKVTLQVTSFGNVFDIDYEIHDIECPQHKQQELNFQTSATIKTPQPGSRPIKPIVIIPTKEEESLQKPAPSFLQKYWMWILFAMIFFLMNTSDPKPAEGNAGAAAPPARK